MSHYTHNKQRRQKPALFVCMVVLALVIMAGVSAFVFRAIDTQPPAPAKAVTAAHKSVHLTSSMQFVGDVFWGRQVQRRAEASGQGPAYLTSGLPSPAEDAYDAWIGNFECPVTENDISYEQQVKYLKFNCRPEYLSEFSKWFTATSLANNHTDNNRGKDGQAETRQHLASANIQYFGSYDMGDTADICEVIAMPARLGKEQSYMPVALCGYMQVVNVAPTNEQLAVMTEYAKVMPVIAMPHMGVEYTAVAETAKETAYQRMIDAGADMVIGAHPHVIQNSENYKGKLIAYSLGNFLFDQQSLGEDTSIGLSVGVTLDIPNTEAARMYAAVGKSCMQHKDSCLQKLQKRLTVRPKIEVSYRYGCYDQRQKIPTPGDEATCAAARQRATVDNLNLLANW